MKCFVKNVDRNWLVMIISAIMMNMMMTLGTIAIMNINNVLNAELI